MAETMIWGMHAGKNGEADPIFLKKNAVALGWVEIGDLRKINPLADLVAHLLNIIGYHTRILPEGPDGGIDIIAHRDELGFEQPIVKVQVKSVDGNIGDPMVSSLYGKVGADEHGLLVALGSYTQQAKNFAKSKTNLRLIDGQELVDLLLSHYDDLDSRYKGLLPLKRVYIPESIKDQED